MVAIQFNKTQNFPHFSSASVQYIQVVFFLFFFLSKFKHFP